jgi:cytosine/adenosine deaminase-related metal-dependent hydrolase
VDSVTRHPARLLRLGGVLGSLRRGAWADMVLLDDNLHVLQTYLAGQLVWAGGPGELSRAAGASSHPAAGGAAPPSSPGAHGGAGQ